LAIFRRLERFLCLKHAKGQRPAVCVTPKVAEMVAVQMAGARMGKLHRPSGKSTPIARPRKL